LAVSLEQAPEPAGDTLADFDFEGESARVGLRKAASS
jgi:hypothetical protein